MKMLFWVALCHYDNMTDRPRLTGRTYRSTDGLLSLSLSIYIDARVRLITFPIIFDIMVSVWDSIPKISGEMILHSKDCLLCSLFLRGTMHVLTSYHCHNVTPIIYSGSPLFFREIKSVNTTNSYHSMTEDHMIPSNNRDWCKLFPFKRSLRKARRLAECVSN